MKLFCLLLLALICIAVVPLRAQPKAPPFVFRSLDDTTRFISSESLEGKVYLVDFWATWCPPCVEALPELEHIHKEFSPRGFTIVSLSFDASDERVRSFRQKRFTMPWLHGRLNGGFNDIIALAFALENIPHYILVNRDGGIIAEGNDIHGERLRDLLREHVR
ncbi:MAG: TlpA family protein disulfide reductase [Bacteroidia bacterium]|nr:TlpA family protein disulfide reductase [Bacteroidia bacterium]